MIQGGATVIPLWGIKWFYAWLHIGIQYARDCGLKVTVLMLHDEIEIKVS